MEKAQEEREKFSTSLFLQGFKKAFPMMIQVFISGLGFGIIAQQGGLSWGESMLMSLLVYAGSSQFTAVGMMNLPHLAVVPIILTTLLVNIRHLLYGASLAPYVKDFSLRQQAIFAFGITDESYALNISRFSTQGASYSYGLGVNAGVYLSWIVGTGIGAALGGLIQDPLTWGIDFIMSACFIAIVVPLLIQWKEIVVAILAGVLAVVGMMILPGKWYIIVATIIAVAIGGGLDLLWEEK